MKQSKQFQKTQQKILNYFNKSFSIVFNITKQIPLTISCRTNKAEKKTTIDNLPKQIQIQLVIKKEKLLKTMEKIHEYTLNWFKS